MHNSITHRESCIHGTKQDWGVVAQRLKITLRVSEQERDLSNKKNKIDTQLGVKMYTNSFEYIQSALQQLVQTEHNNRARPTVL